MVKPLFYNYTLGKVAIPMLWRFFERYPSAEATRQADWKPIADLLQPLGLNELRAKILVRFSGELIAYAFTPEWKKCHVFPCASLSQ